MSYLERFMADIECSVTPYHAVETIKNKFLSADFVELKESETWNLERNKKYFAVRNGSAVIAFTTGSACGFNIVAAHTDSPCLKVKKNPEITTGGVRKLNVETYGGGLWYTWFDRPLKLAGRYVEKTGDELRVKLFKSERCFVVPSVAIHFNREANTSFAVNSQIDLMPVVGLGAGESVIKESWLDEDLFVVSDEKPFLAGEKGEFLVSPRLDDLASAFAAAEAVINAPADGLSVCFLADNEEVGSSTKQGAGGTFLKSTLKRIACSLGMDFDAALASSFMVSADNAHAVHPNHPEKSDPTNSVTLGEGVVVKHHANQNYTTDAVSSAVIKQIAEKAGVKTQDFFMRSDLRCGSTLGAISSSQVSVKSVDVGIAQLAMHSAVETVAASDLEAAVKLFEGFFKTKIQFPEDGRIILK